METLVETAEKTQCEYLKVETIIPKAIVAFLNDCGISIEDWLKENVLELFGSQLNTSYEHPTIFGNPNAPISTLIQKHALGEVPGLSEYIENDLIGAARK